MCGTHHITGSTLGLLHRLDMSFHLIQYLRDDLVELPLHHQRVHQLAQDAHAGCVFGIRYQPYLIAICLQAVRPVHVSQWPLMFI